MTIYDQIKKVCDKREGGRFSRTEIVGFVEEQFGTNRSSIIPSDYCYNRINKGISFNKHLFIRLSSKEYQYVGEDYPYTGWIFQKSRMSNREVIAGRWENGSYKLFKEGKDVESSVTNLGLQLDQIEKLYEEYLSLLQLEVDVFGCKPTETRHLIGRIGEFKAALETQGSLAKQVNQAGFDVVSREGRTISVKTTAQQTGFVSLNKRTAHLVDDLMVIQFKEGDFAIIFYGSMDMAIKSSRQYSNRCELDIENAKKLMTAAAL